MALGIPEFRRVRPEKYLKFGPDLSSSHCKQSFKDPSGLLNGSSVIHDQMQTEKHFERVFLMLYCQILAHSSEKPMSLRQSNTCCCPEIFIACYLLPVPISFRPILKHFCFLIAQKLSLNRLKIQ